MVVGVSVDSPSALDLVEGFLEEMGVTYDILLDPEMVSTEAFAPIGYPASSTYTPPERGPSPPGRLLPQRPCSPSWPKAPV